VKLLLDVNLSPALAALLSEAGHDVVHWSDVGDFRAPDVTIMGWAETHQRILVTHDLDSGAILAGVDARGLSVIQIRGQDLMAPETAAAITNAITAAGPALLRGAVVTIHDDRSRIRILPLRSAPPDEA
jgi:predicted nuclease of predicted toxin-antitoxin system